MQKLLGVRKTTSNMMVYFELGRLPLQIIRKIKIVKYWLKLITWMFPEIHIIVTKCKKTLMNMEGNMGIYMGN